MPFLDVDILAQPDDVTCGPTSLHAVYRYLGLDLDLETVIAEVDALEEGGTLGVLLGLDAIQRGFGATLFSYNLEVFDPSWARLPPDQLGSKLEAQLEFKTRPRFVHATRAYQRFLQAGGRLTFEELGVGVLARYFDRGLPVLAGLSATFLYGTPREYTTSANVAVFDDLVGHPVGHFVVLAGMDDSRIKVVDPLATNPMADDHVYYVDPQRLFHAILLGIVTYDANMLVIEPGARP